MTLYGRGLRPLAILTVLTLVTGLGLALLFAPLDADQGVRQKIFYVHVPMSVVALGGFIAGAIFAIRHLRSGDRREDLRSYVAIHLSLVLAVGVLITGSIWAKTAWGSWFVWDEPMLVSFLIVFLLYATYQPLRFSIEDPERQARYASVFAIVAGAFVPLNLAAVRMAQSYIHPETFSQTSGDGMPGPALAAFLLTLVGMTLLFVTLWKYEMASKHTRAQVKALRRRLAGEGAPLGGARSAAPRVTA